MAKNQCVVASKQTLENFIIQIRELYGDGAYLMIEWKKGKEATMPQKALVHIWFRKYSAFLNKKREADVTSIDMVAIKRSAKVQFYNETHESFMVEEIADPFHPDRKRMDMTSIGDWGQADTYHFMTWLQQKAMHQGLILESIGENKRMTQESYGR